MGKERESYILAQGKMSIKLIKDTDSDLKVWNLFDTNRNAIQHRDYHIQETYRI